MDREWNQHQPIYRQLRDRVVPMILEGGLREGDAYIRSAGYGQFQPEMPGFVLPCKEFFAK